jgi:hypothetical protein
MIHGGMIMNILIKTTGELGFKSYLFLTYENDGVKEYYLNEKMVDKDEGNKTYLKIKNGEMGRIIDSILITENNKEDIMKYYLEAYDKYVHYIDDYRRYSKQVETNEKVYEIAKLIDKCVKSKDKNTIQNLFMRYIYG